MGQTHRLQIHQHRGHSNSPSSRSCKLTVVGVTRTRSRRGRASSLHIKTVVGASHISPHNSIHFISSSGAAAVAVRPKLVSLSLLVILSGLLGGQVDYGEEQSKAFGHLQFGRDYEQGHYFEWDEDHHIHFVGHTAGAQVVRVLQQILADKSFKGYKNSSENSSENWVLSITFLSGPFNGTTRAYLDGIQPEDGGSLKPICLLQLRRLGVIIYDWLDIPLLKYYYNFGFDHFNMSWRKVGIRGLVDLILGNTGPFASGDWILSDLTIQGSMQLNCHLQTFPNTYYFSYATKRTRKIMGLTVSSSILGIHPLLFIRVLQVSQWTHPPDASPPYKGYRDENWWDNDGAMNTISMTYPHLPIEHPNHYVVNDADCQPLQPGIWLVIFLTTVICLFELQIIISNVVSAFSDPNTRETSKRKRENECQFNNRRNHRVFEKNMKRASADIAKLTEAITGGDTMTRLGVELEDFVKAILEE
ncbi:hypothetical protein Ddye_015749 [Dipteronia dyeriana]|uniref:Lipase-like C-terminal domain-containing protein n=1 Tax=Dipteronia dyeriana TaxID=168575 RepID=A0AAD9U5E5_9ROSI|nr:hypothetical protein Ddye_015749 [Dipteronia dyeriana]